MANNGRRRQKGSFVEVKSELSKVRLDVQGLAEKMSAVEKDKENLRTINQKLLEKIKKELDKNYPFQMFLLRKELEREREKSMLTSEKLVESQILAVFFKECFGISIDTDVNNPAMTLRSAMDVMKDIQKQWENEREHHTQNADSLLQNQKSLEQKMEALRMENQSLREEKMAEYLSSQAIIDSLQDILKEQREEMEAEMQARQDKVDTSKEKEAALNRRISELEQELCTTKESLSDSENKVANYKEAKSELEKNVDDLRKELIGLEELAAMSFAKLKDLHKNVNKWQSKAVKSDASCRELAKKLKDSHRNQLLMLRGRFKTEERVHRLQKENELLSKNVEALDQEVKETEQLLENAKECFKITSSDLLEMTSKMNCWKTKSEQLESELLAAEEKNDKLEEDQNELRMSTVLEFNKNLEQSLSLKSEIDWLQADIKTQGGKFDALKSENVALMEQLEELRKQKSKAQEDLRVMSDENAILNDAINQLEQRIDSKRNRRWWRRLVSCS